MPPRWLSILIVAVWLLFSGRLVVRDLLPRLLPGQPPPYSIDLVEEIRSGRSHVDWAVLHDGKKVFRSRSRVLHPEPDVFELTAEFLPVQKPERVPLHGMLVSSLVSTYRVTGAGDLLGVKVKIVGTPQLAQTLRLLGDTDFTISIDGAVKDRRFVPRVRIGIGEKGVREFALPGVAIQQGGSVLLPLHPVNRILHARVRPQPEWFAMGSRRTDKPVLCLVVDYEGDDFTASTWVERERGLVMCQEATLGGDRWLMYRE